MATDFNKNSIVLSGGIKPSTKDTPGDIRTRVDSIANVELIPLPYIGMIFYVEDEKELYIVKSLKGKRIGAIEIKDSIVDEFEKLNKGFATEEYVEQKIAEIEVIPGPMGPKGDQGPEGPAGKDADPIVLDGFATKEYVDEKNIDLKDEFKKSLKHEVDLIHEEMVEEVGLINQEMEEEIQKVNDVITEQVQKINSEHTEHVVTLYGKCKDLRLKDEAIEERVNVLETLNLETKPYIDKNGMLVLCGCPAIARGVGEEVHVTVRFFNDEEDKFVFTKDEFAKLRICMGYGAEGVGAKRGVVETTLEMYDIDKVFIIDGGSQITGEIGTVNIIAERCNYIDGIQGARAMNGGEKNLVHNFNVKVKDVKLIDTLFGGGNGYSVVWNSNIEVEGETEINYLIAGGSNGYTNKSRVVVNGGHIKVMQGVNRGILNKAELIVNNGIVDKFYVAGENDPGVTGVQHEAYVELNGGQIIKFFKGISGSEEYLGEIKGHIKDCVVVNGDVSMLVKIEEEPEVVKVQDRFFMINETGLNLELPEGIENFGEVHIFVQHKAGKIVVKNECKWQAEMPELVENNFYEFIFTKVGNVWLAGCVEYK